MVTDVRLAGGGGACVHDSFVRADNPASLGVADSGQAWVLQTIAPTGTQGTPIAAQPSVWGIRSDTAYTPGPAYDPTMNLPIDIATIDHGFSSGDFTVSIGTSPSTESGAGMVLRWQDATHFIACFVYKVSVSGVWHTYLREFNGAAITDIVAHASPDITVLLVQVRGDEFNVTGDGSFIMAGSSSYGDTATRHGLFGYQDPLFDIFGWQGCPVPGRKVMRSRRPTHTSVRHGADI